MGINNASVALARLKAEYNEALSNLDFDKIREIVSILNNAEVSIKRLALPFYQQIYQDTFAWGRTLPNWDIAKFRASAKPPKAVAGQSGGSTSSNVVTGTKPATIELSTPSAPEGVTEPVSGETIENLFVRFYNANLELISKLKDFYLFTFEADRPTEEPEILVVCDEPSKHNPLLAEFIRPGSTKISEISLINDFVAGQSKNTNLFDHDLIVVLALAPTLGGTGVEDAVRSIFDLPYKIRAISILPFNGSIEVEHVSLSVQNEATIKEICNNTDKVFANLGLPYEEQKLIKKFFRVAGVVNYRVLSQGWSGATVFEVQNINTAMPMTRRFVAKVAPKKPGVESKLRAEESNFASYVLPAATTTPYSAKYIETDLLEAIFYSYASKDGLRNSRPLKEILDSFQNGKTSLAEVEATIDRLWDCGIFEAWTATRAEKEISSLFSPHLASSDKVIEKVKKILLPADLARTSLISNFKTIYSKKILTKTKVCHGDLHSQNFFDDGDTAVLIDFGITGIHQALVDHVFLEASLRLRHFPQYVPPSELLEYDRNFLDIKCFSLGVNLDFVERPELKDLYKLITRIRADAIKYLADKTSPDEYLVALFVITFRLIQYDNLNQLYALKLAEQLGSYLITSPKLQ